jgi:assimilatory nitrate reductase catalytic subunit
MTRTGLAPELCRHAPEPYVEIHPADARPLGIGDGALTRVLTAQGEAVAKAKLTDRQRPGSVFMPMHWTDAFAPSGRANPLVAAEIDPRSGQPEFKHTPARVRPYRETWRGFFLAREAWPAPASLDLVWRRIPHAACQLHEFAGRGDERERAAVQKALTRKAGDVLRFQDSATGGLREAWIDGGRLERVIFFTTAGALPPRDWLADLFAADALTPADRTALLIGRQPGQAMDFSPVVCACRGVRTKPIEIAIVDGCATLDAIGDVTGAGANCGSCRPEIARLLATTTKDVCNAA